MVLRESAMDITVHNYKNIRKYKSEGQKMFEAMNEFLVKVDDLVWGIPLIVLILATGILLTIRLKGLQITKLPLAVKHMFANDNSGSTGEVSSFGALCTALSATIGTGNIVGVATAIVAGGPGALFWMWVAAFVGTAPSYVGRAPYSTSVSVSITSLPFFQVTVYLLTVELNVAV